MKRFFAGIILCFLLFGCLSAEQEFEARMACARISTGSYLDVPECVSPNDCFSKVESVFATESDGLSFEGRQALFEYKSVLGRSWFFFNRANQEIDFIRKTCFGTASLSILPDHVNRARSDLSEGLKTLEKANEQAVAFMSIELRQLDFEDVNQAKEEPAFEAWVLLSSNLEELSIPVVASRTGLAMKISAVREKLSRIARKSGFGEAFVSSTSVWDLVPERVFVENAPQPVSVVLPSFWGFFKSFSNKLSEEEKQGNALSVLSTIPAFDFFEAISETAGAHDSVASEFFALVSTVNEKEKESRKNSARLEAEAMEKISEIKSRINALDFSEFEAWDENGWQELAERVNAAQSAEVGWYSVTAFSDGKEKFSIRVLELEKKASELKKQRVAHTASLGEQLDGWKKILLLTKALEENVFFLDSEMKDGLLNACEEHVKSVREKKKTVEWDAPLIEGIKARLFFLTEKFSDEKQIPRKLFFCKETLDAEVLLEKAEQDLQTALLEFENKTGECRLRLTELFDTKNEALESALPAYRLFLELSSANNSVETLENCENVWKQSVFLVTHHPKTKKIEERFGKMKRQLREIEEMTKAGGQPQADRDVEKKFGEIAAFFRNEKLVLSGKIPSFGELEKKMDTLEELIHRQYADAIVAFFEGTAVIRPTENAVIDLHSNEFVEAEIVFPSPGETLFEEEFRVFVGNIGRDVDVESFSFPVSTVIEKNNGIEVVFSQTAPRETIIRIRTRFFVSFSETEEWIGAHRETAMLLRTIRVESPVKAPSLLISVRLAPKEVRIEEVLVLVGSVAVDYSVSDSNVLFFIPGEKHQQAQIYYSLRSPIIENEHVRESPGLVTKTVSIRNRLDKTIPELWLSWKRPQAADQIRVFDQKNHEIPLQMEPESFRVRLKEIAPFQTVLFSIELSVPDERLFALGEKDRLRKELEELSADSTEAKLLLGELLGLSVDNQSGRERILSMEPKVAALISRAQSEQKGISEFELLLSNLERKKEEKKAESVSLRKIGKGNYAVEVDRRIESVPILISRAHQLATQKNFPGAMEVLIKANESLIAAIPELEKELMNGKKTVSDAWNKTQDLLAKEKLKPSEKALDWSGFDEAVYERNYGDAFFELERVKEQAALGSNRLNEAVFEKKRGLLEELDRLSEFNLKERKSRLAFLNRILSASEEQKIRETGIVLGFSRQSIAGLSARIDQVATEKIKQNATEIRTLFDSNRYADGLLGLEEEPNVLTASTELERVSKETEFDVNSFRDLALAELIKAKQRAATDNESVSLLKKSKDFFDRQEYAKSILAAKEVRSSNGIGAGLTFLGADVPVFGIPLVIAVGVWLLFRRKKKKEEPKERTRVKLERIRSAV